MLVFKVEAFVVKQKCFNIKVFLVIYSFILIHIKTGEFELYKFSVFLQILQHSVTEKLFFNQEQVFLYKD